MSGAEKRSKRPREAEDSGDDPLGLVGAETTENDAGALLLNGLDDALVPTSTQQQLGGFGAQEGSSFLLGGGGGSATAGLLGLGDMLGSTQQAGGTLLTTGHNQLLATGTIGEPTENNTGKEPQSPALYERLPSSSGSDESSDSSDDDDNSKRKPKANAPRKGQQLAAGDQQSGDGQNQPNSSTNDNSFQQAVKDKKFSSGEVHKTFQEHWKKQDKQEAVFHAIVYDDLLGGKKERYARLVNIGNWGTAINQSADLGVNGPTKADREEDVLLPRNFIDPSLLPAFGGLSQGNIGGGQEGGVAANFQLPDETSDDEGDNLPALSLGLPLMVQAKPDRGPEAPVPPLGEFSLRPHQVDGIRFLWKRLAQVPEKPVPATGCILAHSMGLGKSCQTLVFLHLFYKHIKPNATTLLVLPKSVISSWVNEEHRWGRYFPEDRLPSYQVFQNIAPRKEQRVSKFVEWMKTGGVLVIGYEALANLYIQVQRGKEGGTITRDNIAFHPASSIDLIICDEGHRLKNDSLQVSTALKQLKPKRRLVITGTPLQNHLMEYWAMVDFILPKYFTKRSFKNYFIKPIRESMHKDATSFQIMLAKKRTYTLIQELGYYVHRRDNEVLRRELPPLNEFICIVPLTKIQHQLYEKFLSVFRAQQKKSLLQAISYAAKICAHPELLFAPEDNEGAKTKPGRKSTRTTTTTTTAGGAAEEGILDGVLNLDSEEEDLEDDADQVAIISQKQGASPAAFKSLTFRPKGYEPSPEDSTKMNVALQIILKAKALGESCLVFSMSTKLLDFFETCMQVAGQMHHEDSNYIKYIRLDGSTSSSKREELIRRFQSEDEESRIDCFLLSMKAGGLGVTLTAATRVIILDCAWNPTDDRQAVGRAYRYGQTKPVFIYRLVCNNTIEHRVFDQKVGKEWLFRTVVDTDTMKRDTLKGPKLQEVFIMADPLYAQPLRQDWTDECCAIDDLLKSVYNEGKGQQTSSRNDEGSSATAALSDLILGVMPHDSLLEEDPVKYGDEEHAAYKEFLKKGGLWQGAAEMEGGPNMDALRRRRQLEELEVKTQSRAMLTCLKTILEARQKENEEKRKGFGILTKMNKAKEEHLSRYAGGSAFPVQAVLEGAAVGTGGRVGGLLRTRQRVDGLGSSKSIPMEIDGDPLLDKVLESKSENSKADDSDDEVVIEDSAKKNTRQRPTSLGVPVERTGENEDDPLIIE